MVWKNLIPELNDNLSGTVNSHNSKLIMFAVLESVVILSVQLQLFWNSMVWFGKSDTEGICKTLAMSFFFTYAHLHLYMKTWGYIHIANNVIIALNGGLMPCFQNSSIKNIQQVYFHLLLFIFPCTEKDLCSQ